MQLCTSCRLSLSKSESFFLSLLLFPFSFFWSFFFFLSSSLSHHTKSSATEYCGNSVVEDEVEDVVVDESVELSDFPLVVVVSFLFDEDDDLDLLFDGFLVVVNSVRHRPPAQTTGIEVSLSVKVVQLYPSSSSLRWSGQMQVPYG